VPWLLVVPTMEHPEAIPPVNVLRAMSALLRAVDRHGLDEVFCPGLGTGVGQVPPEEAARQMALAYGRWKARGAGPV
jgi:O-acetyl-ADP-ribose deacetylase (regulator of RNase III)